MNKLFKIMIKNILKKYLIYMINYINMLINKLKVKLESMKV